MRIQTVPRKSWLLWLFVFSLVFLSPLAIRAVAFTSFSHYVIWGMLLSTIVVGLKTNDLKISHSLWTLVSVVLIWLLITLFDSIIFHDAFGTIGGQDTFDAIKGSCYFHMFYVMSFVLIVKNISFSQDTISIERAMNAITDISIIIGVLQIGVLWRIPGFSAIYNSINFLNMIKDANYIINTEKIPLTGSEPASLGNILCVLIMPYLFMQMQSTASKKKYLLRLVFCYCFAFLSKSTTVYLLVVIVSAVFIVKNLRTNGKSSSRISALILVVTMVIIVLSILGFIGFSMFGFLGDKDDVFSIRYILIYKVFDFNNMSSAHRWSTPINDLAVFLDYPLTGVGDGNQGFFYSQNISSDIAINSKTQDFISGKYGVVNGGAFLFAILSGCGVLGLVPLMGFIKVYINKYRMAISTSKYALWLTYAIVPIILELLTGAMEMIIVFVLSIPFWSVQNKNE